MKPVDFEQIKVSNEVIRRKIGEIKADNPHLRSLGSLDQALPIGDTEEDRAEEARQKKIWAEWQRRAARTEIFEGSFKRQISNQLGKSVPTLKYKPQVDVGMGSKPIMPSACTFFAGTGSPAPS
jgi:hypothetical protein